LDDKEFLDSLRILDDSEDCPDELIKMAKSPFEKAVCIEFFKLYKEFQEFRIKSNTNMKWLKWLITGVFSVTVVTLLFQLIRTFCFGL
jgi:hypothetical protein